MKTIKIITAGPLVKAAIYPRARGGEAPKVRAAKKKLSSAAQKLMNAKYQKEKLEMLVAANYSPRDLWVTLTFRDADLPDCEAQVNACMKAFLRALRKQRGRKLPPVVIWRAEHKHRDETDRLQDARWHVHLFLNASGDDYDTIRSCWPYGDDIHIEKIVVDREHSYAQLAAYLVKEPLDRSGAHAWHATRNLRKPEVEIIPVEDDAQLQTPKGCTVIERCEQQNEFGAYRYVKYLTPFGARRTSPTARRRRKR